MCIFSFTGQFYINFQISLLSLFLIVCVHVCVSACVRVCMSACVYTHCVFFTHSSVDGHSGCFHILSTVNSAAVNIGVLESFRIIVVLFWIYTQEWNWLPYGSPVFSVLGNLKAHTGLLLHCWKQCVCHSPDLLAQSLSLVLP